MSQTGLGHHCGHTDAMQTFEPNRLGRGLQHTAPRFLLVGALS
ncbi:MAG: hypothetical protein SXG53_16720 [Pseudomonadota bacterium]|nr:hypothetical protein [Pseudomonadota bacterium]